MYNKNFESLKDGISDAKVSLAGISNTVCDPRIKAIVNTKLEEAELWLGRLMFDENTEDD